MKPFPQIVRDMPPAMRFLGVVMLLQLVLWTLLPDLLFSVLPLDTLEAIAWGSGFSLGNAKHPPLTGWIAGLTAVAAGHADWPFYLLSQICVVGGMVFIYLLAREFLGRGESVLAALTPQFILYYNVTSFEFNVNMPMLLLWPAAALFFVRACKRDRLRDWILLGTISGLCLLCKYYSALLFAAFGVYLLTSKTRCRLILSAGPWIAAACCGLVILPHAMWAMTGGLAMMEAYVEGRMATRVGASWFKRHIAGSLIILGNAVLVIVIPFGMFWLSKLERPRVPAEPERREGMLFSLVMTGIPLLVLTVVGFSGGNVRTMWLVPVFFPLGILLASLFHAEWSEKQWKRFRASVLIFMALALIGVAVGNTAHSSLRKHFPAGKFTAEISAMYQEQTGRPLDAMAGDAWTAGMFRHCAPGHPQACILRNRSELNRLGPMLQEHGGLVVSDKEEDIQLAMEYFGSAVTLQTSYDIDYHSLLGKKRKKTIHLAFLNGSAAK